MAARSGPPVKPGFTARNHTARMSSHRSAVVCHTPARACGMLKQRGCTRTQGCGRHWCRALIFGLVAAISTGAGAECQSGQTSGKEAVGTLLGAAVGGLLGAQIGSGTANKVAIGAGVLGGGLLGNRLGAHLDCRDQQYHAHTAQTAFETRRTGHTSSWINPDTGHAGSITPVRTYRDDDGSNCRDFQQTIELDDGRNEIGHGSACREADGSWRIVRTQ